MSEKSLGKYFNENYIHHTDNFVEKTLMHAVKQVHYRKCGSLKQYFWIAVIVIFFGVSFYGSQKLLIKFLQLPSQTNVKIESQFYGFTFPDVTFCDPYSKKLRDTIVPLNKSTLIDKESLLKWTNLSDIIVEAILKHEYKNMTPMQQLKTKSMAHEHFLNITSMYPRALDRIIMCKYNGKDCDYTNFTTTYHRDYHNCYTFHTDIQPRVGKNFGLFVLFMVPDSEWSERIDIVNDLASESVLVEIREPNSVIRPAQIGFSVPLSVMTDIELTQSKMDVQEGSNLYYKCEPTSIWQYRDLQFEQDKYYKRDIRDCIENEYLDNIAKTCGCYPEGPIKSSDSNFKNDSITEYCSNFMDSFFDKNRIDLLKVLNEAEQLSEINAMINNATGYKIAQQFRCLWRNYKKFSDREIYYHQSNCKPSCTYKYYNKNVIQSDWPQSGNFQQISSKTQMLQVATTLRNYFKLLKIDVKNLSQTNFHEDPQLVEVFKSNAIVNLDVVLNGCEKNKWDFKNCSTLTNIIRKNMAFVNFYAGLDTSIDYYFVLSFDIFDLLSKVGGTFSLWLGFSVLTLVEIGELFLRFGYVAIQMCIMKYRCMSESQSSITSSSKLKHKKKRESSKEFDNAGYQPDEGEQYMSDWL